LSKNPQTKFVFFQSSSAMKLYSDVRCLPTLYIEYSVIQLGPSANDTMLRSAGNS